MSRDNEVLDALRAYTAEYGRMPTHKEFCASLRVTRGQLWRNLSRLVKRGDLKALPRGTMAYQVAEKGPS